MMNTNQKNTATRIAMSELTVWTKSRFATEVLEPEVGLSKKNAMLVLKTLLRCINESLATERSVRLRGAGNLIVRYKSARPGRNPKSGEECTITPRNVVTLKQSGGANNCVAASEMMTIVHEELPLIDLPKIEFAVKAFHKLVADVVLGEYRIEMRDFGNFHPVVSGPRTARNPKTGESIMTTPRTKIHFKPSHYLRGLVNERVLG